MDPIYEYSEKVFDKYLLELGVPQEVLDQDLGSRLTISGSYGYKKELELPDIGKVRENDICNVLNKMDVDTLKTYWEVEEFRERVAALIRYPGGLHEWLMISAIPVLREMGIPMGFIKDYRDATDSCTFTIDGEKGRHGGNLSTKMHNILYYFILRAKDIHMSSAVDAKIALAQCLEEFMKVVEPHNPEVLQDLINKLKQ